MLFGISASESVESLFLAPCASCCGRTPEPGEVCVVGSMACTTARESSDDMVHPGVPEPVDAVQRDR